MAETTFNAIDKERLDIICGIRGDANSRAVRWSDSEKLALAVGKYLSNTSFFALASGLVSATQFNAAEARITTLEGEMDAVEAVTTGNIVHHVSSAIQTKIINTTTDAAPREITPDWDMEFSGSSLVRFTLSGTFDVDTAPEVLRLRIVGIFNAGGPDYETDLCVFPIDLLTTAAENGLAKTFIFDLTDDIDNLIGCRLEGWVNGTSDCGLSDWFMTVENIPGALEIAPFVISP
ncbi:hypothetical protein [Maritimibacter sp. DP1N21-5]|uniref:hypothetical protein n=1 Tax=Maritimibacter sp. DP1N21-5 TaxID=2836867 RepID=UPI001C455C5D|nr:hypothetical protein [Maritimibacter sp. DP1N21-5]MBV7408768.1 hypothetical protein [Maritimibacter sp. DP1N21-5]